VVSGSDAIVIDRLSYFYPKADVPALRDLSFEIERGDFLGLIGPTGAGKTTFCLALNGIVPQFYGGRFFGSVTVLGLDTVEHPTRRLARHVGAVFQDPETQLIAPSVEDEIAFALENLSVPRDEIRRRIPAVLELVRLEGTERKHPHELSGGQKQRLAIGAALAMQPDILVLDEPTSQLDPLGQREVFTVLRELNEGMGVTVVIASHASEMLAEYADRVALMADGGLQAVGSPDDVYTRRELLLKHHLRPPQVTTTFSLAVDKGLPVDKLPVRMVEGEQLLDEFAGSYPSALREPDELDAESATGSGDDSYRDPVISAHNLHYRYSEGTAALKGISLDIQAGEYVLLVGQNGAGKTTLIKHFTRLLLPTTGRVAVFGAETQALSVSQVARRVGYVGQNPDHQLFRTTVESEVAYALKQRNLPRDGVVARVSDSLREMDLLSVRDKHPLSLLRGDRARVVMAAVLAMQPEVLILDEPTTGQDYWGARRILDILAGLHRRGKTIIVITHHLYLMADYAERVVVMGEGTLLADGPIREIFHRTGVLRSTYLEPPQAVLLAQYWSQRVGRPYPLLTPAELASALGAASNSRTA
jgi:energy-coupling factor transport system ATP-binding protein